MNTVVPNSQIASTALLDQISIAIWIFDIDQGRVCWANLAAMEVWAAQSRDELYARDMGADMSPAVARRLKQYQSDFIAHGSVFNETWTIYPRGVPRTLRVRYSGALLGDGRMGMLCEGYEDHAIKPETLRSTDALLHTQVMISLHHEEGQALYLNPAARAAFDGSQRHLAARFVQPQDYAQLLEQVRAHGEASLTCQVHTSQGIRWHELTARHCLDPASGQPAILVGQSDVTQIKEAEALAQELAHRDHLTQLPNRLALPRIFARLCQHIMPPHGKLGLFFIDLDQFKLINDTLGHRQGDDLLTEAAHHLRSLCGPHDATIRLGGDEFLFLATQAGPQDEGRFERLAQEMCRLLSITKTDGNRRYLVTPSIGIACYPEHGHDAETLVQCADVAMHEAKQSGRNRFTMFEAPMREARTLQTRLQADLELAFERDEFLVYYQPRYSGQDNCIVSVEALARWQHPEKGLISPGDFIPLCERTGLIDRLGALVLRRALEQQRQWKDMGADLAVSVNVSLRQLGNPGFGDMVRHMLQTTGCDPARLELELTESALSEAGNIVEANLDSIRAQGICIAIDDFGTGYSNLARLSEMAVDCIKIDRSLVQKLPHDTELMQIVIGMCQLMQATIVAEGIETADTAQWLRDAGCHELQGYFYGRPMPAAALQALLFPPPASPAATTPA